MQAEGAGWSTSITRTRCFGGERSSTSTATWLSHLLVFLSKPTTWDVMGPVGRRGFPVQSKQLDADGFLATADTSKRHPCTRTLFVSGSQPFSSLRMERPSSCVRLTAQASPCNRHGHGLRTAATSWKHLASKSKSCPMSPYVIWTMTGRLFDIFTISRRLPQNRR